MGKSENRQRTEAILVRLTPAERKAVKVMVRLFGVRGEGTVLREAAMREWVKLQEIAGAPKRAPGQPDTDPVLSPAQRSARARAGASEPTAGKQ